MQGNKSAHLVSHKSFVTEFYVNLNFTLKGYYKFWLALKYSEFGFKDTWVKWPNYACLDHE